MSRRAIVLPPWEEYNPGPGFAPTAIEFHTEFYKQNEAEQAAQDLIREIDNRAASSAFTTPFD